MSLLLTGSLYSQQNELALKAEDLVYSNPDEAIKIADHILNSSKNSQESAIANLILAKSHLVKGNYNEVIVYAFDDTNQLDEIDARIRIENYIIRATILRKLYIDNQSKEYLNKASILVSGLTSDKDQLEYLISLEHINSLLDRLNTDEAIAEIKEGETRFKNLLNTDKNKKRAYYLAKGQAFNSQSNYDSAYVYIDKTLELLDASKKNNLYEKAIIYKESGHLALQKKEFEKSKEMLFIAIRFAEIIGNPFLLEQINRDLAINYLASNQQSQHKVYYEESLLLNNRIEKIEEESVNTFYNLVSGQEKKQFQTKNQKYTYYLYITLGSAILIIIFGLLILLKSENRKKRKREIINYLDVSRNNFMTAKTPIKQTSKRSAIPEETEQNLILKLKHFEKSLKYLKKDMSLALLAGQFETNTKYLSEIINKTYNDNFNTFINKLRINYIIEKLKNDSNYSNYKISFLAEESGFSSHSSFATVFKSIIGMSPATFINLLKIEREEIKKKKEIE